MVVLNDKLIVLEFSPGTVENVRKDVNLEKEGRIDEAVDILAEWVKKQQHFVKKDFSREYLERTLITAKGLVERAKMRIDKLCTFKTLMPEMIPCTVATEDSEILKKYVSHAHLPKMTKEYYRVYILKCEKDDFDSSDIVVFYRYLALLGEYLKRYDYNSGLIIVLDYMSINILNLVAKSTPTELRKMITLMTEGYSLRIKQIHIMSPSKMIDAFVTLLKQVLSDKLASRLHLHKHIDTLTDFVCKDILPEEYGGKERSLRKLNEEWRNAISSPDFVEYYEEMCKAKTDESCRQQDKFTEQYVGMPGSFRALSVD